MPDKYTKKAGKILDFNKLRFNNKHHLGLGDIRITIGQQEEIEKVVADLLKQIDELEAGSIEVGVEDIEKNIKIMSDEKIEKAPNPEYAGAYNQGKFDVLMEIKRLNKLKEKE